MFPMIPSRIYDADPREVLMPNNKQYKQFFTQFNAAEWKILRGHRLFLHFLRIDLKRAASFAADALDRNVFYVFPVLLRPTQPISNKSQMVSNASWRIRRQRRFRL